MNKKEYIKRFIKRYCEILPFALDDEVPQAEALYAWDEYSADGSSPESEAEEAAS